LRLKFKRTWKIGVQIGGGLELIFLDEVSRFGIEAQIGGGLELLSVVVCRTPGHRRLKKEKKL
jgi:hypothetical protein